jgi:general stress protein 26
MVNLSYTDQEEEVYVSISGRATIVKDNYKMQEFWKPALEEWFPGGLTDNDLALLKIEMEHAEYWNGRNMIQIWDTTSAVKV